MNNSEVNIRNLEITKCWKFHQIFYVYYIMKYMGDISENNFENTRIPEIEYQFKVCSVYAYNINAITSSKLSNTFS